MNAVGEVTATLYGNLFWGNSPETVVAQFVAEEFDVDPYTVTVVYSTSTNALPSVGPGGSRVTAMLAGAVAGAARQLKEKALRVGAYLLGVEVDDVVWADGAVRVKGAPTSFKALSEIARMIRFFKHSLPDDIDSGFEASMVYDHPFTRLPSADRTNLGVFYPIMGHACHVPVVEVDVKTGAVTFMNYFVVQDSGTVVNPRSLVGQVMGGVAQGIGTALSEEYVYSESGELLSASWGDYLIPTSMEVPEMTVEFLETPSPYTAYGIKGGGEGGRLAAPSAIAAAVEDALAPFGVRIRELPATPLRIVQVLEQSEPKSAPHAVGHGLG